MALIIQCRRNVPSGIHRYTPRLETRCQIIVHRKRRQAQRSCTRILHDTVRAGVRHQRTVCEIHSHGIRSRTRHPCISLIQPFLRFCHIFICSVRSLAFFEYRPFKVSSVIEITADIPIQHIINHRCLRCVRVYHRTSFTVFRITRFYIAGPYCLPTEIVIFIPIQIEIIRSRVDAVRQITNRAHRRHTAGNCGICVRAIQNTGYAPSRRNRQLRRFSPSLEIQKS